jgi:hypothetical protein
VAGAKLKGETLTTRAFSVNPRVTKANDRDASRQIGLSKVRRFHIRQKLGRHYFPIGGGPGRLDEANSGIQNTLV